MLCAVFAVTFSACRSIFAGGEGLIRENDYNKYGKVQGYGNFFCSPIDENTSRIYIDPLFINTSQKHIKKAVITVEFVDIGKYPTAAYYEPVATYTVVVKNISVGHSKRFVISDDITVDNTADRLDILVSTQVLHAYFHKIEWEIGADRPSAESIRSDRNFI